MFLIKHPHRNSDDKGQQTLKVILSELKIPNKFLVLPLNSCKLVQKYLKQFLSLSEELFLERKLFVMKSRFSLLRWMDRGERRRKLRVNDELESCGLAAAQKEQHVRWRKILGQELPITH